MTDQKQLCFAGTISVKAVLENDRREKYLLAVNPKKRSKDIAYCIALAKQQNIPVEFHDANWLNEHAKDSGGVILFASAGSIPKLSSEIEISGMAVFLDGVEDPYNLGSAARSVYAAGADALLIRKRNWDFALPTILKASAGAFEKLAVYTVEDDESLVQFTQSQNLPLYAAWRGEQAISAFEAVWPKKCLIAIGGALRGLGAAVIENADTCVYIPYGRDFKNALDTPAAAAVLSFLWLQKQEQK